MTQQVVGTHILKHDENGISGVRLCADSTMIFIANLVYPDGHSDGLCIPTFTPKKLPKCYGK